MDGWMDERTRERIDGWTDDGWMMDNLIIDFRPQTKTLTRRVKTLTKRVTV